MNYKKIIPALLSSLYLFPAMAQQAPAGRDSTRFRLLDSVTITAAQQLITTRPLPSVKGTYLFAGKKTEVVSLEYLDVNRVDNNPRQLFSKVPGVFVYENDGTGNQINIATRGLTAHRSWEMNVRHNDVMTNSDLYGYPASHFNAPTESIDRIEIVRGSGALQYGAQFGGMINYITKEADTSRKISYQSQHSVGTYGLLSTYNAIGGKIGKLQYYAYANFRKSDGYRESSDYRYFATHAHLQYAFTRRLLLRLEYNLMDYRNHVNGGLTDAQFAANPKQSTRQRNYYSPTIHVPSIRLDYELNDRTALNLISSAILGSRNSVQFIALSNIPDTFNTSLGSYNPRQVDIDKYHSYAHELRVRHRYKLFSTANTLVAGVRFIHNDLGRQQLGKGTTGSDYDLGLTDPVWGRDLHFKTKNVSVFAENLLQLTPSLAFTAGLRYENGSTKMRGTIRNYSEDAIPLMIDHNFALLGFGAQYTLHKDITVFANWAQAYRPVIFADVIPATTLHKIDHRIKDAAGSNAEFGIRGQLRESLQFDLTFFHMNYRNRPGNIVLPENGQTFFYKTNIGNSRSQGIEFYCEWQPVQWFRRSSSPFRLSVFTSTAYINARYTSGRIAVNGVNEDMKGKWVETTPRWITRNGAQLRYRSVSATIQYSYTGQSYADARNTITPNNSGTVGLVPGYGLVDCNITWRFAKNYNIKLLMNNVFNKQYFTERPPFFPGPGGLYPSDGRSLILSVGVSLF